jgi:hypothetical protein
MVWLAGKPHSLKVILRAALTFAKVTHARTAPFHPTTQNDMIQRIQSLLLLLSGTLMIVLWWLPVAATSSGSGAAYEVQGLEDLGFLHIIAMALGVVSLVTLLLYRNRPLQIKLTTANLLFTFVLMAWMVLQVWQLSENQPEGGHLSIRLGLFVPALCIIFLSTAIRTIRKDERIVRSMDRLR